MASALFCTVLLLFFVINVKAYDIFEGMFPRLRCEKARPTTRCNQTFLDAYKNSSLAEMDQNINEADTWFMLYTCGNKRQPEYLDQCGNGLPGNTLFDPSKQTVIITQGYTEGNCQLAWQREMKDQLLCKYCYNVIITDWGWGNMPDIYNAHKNVPVVGRQTAFFIHNVLNQDPKLVHIIGHSLGAHIAGFAGRYYLLLVGLLLRRITGLDPSGAAFHNSDKRLQKTDAEKVDVIHTGAGHCFPWAIGYYEKSGLVDFYPNGGAVQPSCWSSMGKSFATGDFYYLISKLYPPLCFHRASVEYFISSINGCGCQFVAVQCNSYEEFKSGSCRSCGSDGSKCSVMGMDWELFPIKEGNYSYYLDTAYHCPYCKNNSGIDLGGFADLLKNKTGTCCAASYPP